MDAAIDQTDARILELIQREIPVTREPFRDIAARVSLDPSEVLSRLTRCKMKGILRRVGAIVDSAALGYRGALVAFQVRQDRLDDVGRAVGTHELVSHCYSRDNSYNLWFTITSAPGGDLEAEVASLANRDGVESFLILPALRLFKLGVFLRLSDQREERIPVRVHRPASRPAELSDSAKVAVAALQDDLPIADRPFAQMAAGVGVGEDDLIGEARDLLERGVIRRFAGVLNHRAVGYTHNAMVCWAIGMEEVETLGRKLAEDDAVSHCYERPAFPDWPYTVYTMIHSRGESELAAAIERLAVASGNAPRTVLRTLKEYKKSRGRYSA